MWRIQCKPHDDDDDDDDDDDEDDALTHSDDHSCSVRIKRIIR